MDQREKNDLKSLAIFVLLGAMTLGLLLGLQFLLSVHAPLTDTRRPTNQEMSSRP